MAPDVPPGNLKSPTIRTSKCFMNASAKDESDLGDLLPDHRRVPYDDPPSADRGTVAREHLPADDP
jgi:hypothetical protein